MRRLAIFPSASNTYGISALRYGAASRDVSMISLARPFERMQHPEKEVGQ